MNDRNDTKTVKTQFRRLLPTPSCFLNRGPLGWTDVRIRFGSFLGKQLGQQVERRVLWLMHRIRQRICLRPTLITPIHFKFQTPGFKLLVGRFPCLLTHKKKKNMPTMRPQSRQSKSGLCLVCNAGLNVHRLRHINLLQLQLNTRVISAALKSKCGLLASVILSVWAAVLAALCHVHPNFSPLYQTPLAHTRAFKWGTQRLRLWSAKTHISSLRFHIPGIPS